MYHSCNIQGQVKTNWSTGESNILHAICIFTPKSFHLDPEEGVTYKKNIFFSNEPEKLILLQTRLLPVYIKYPVSSCILKFIENKSVLRYFLSIFGTFIKIIS